MRIHLLLFSLFFSSLIACQQRSTSTEGSMSTVVNIEDAKQLIASDASIQILDVRTPEEHAEGYIKGCTNMDFYADDFDKQIATLNKEKAVFVYCRSGGRSATTAKKMVSLGFKEVYDLGGGMTAWQEAGEPVEK